MTKAGIRLLCALFLSVLALAGGDGGAWEPGAGRPPAATAETARPPTSLSRGQNPHREAFRHAHPALKVAARGTASLLVRLPAPDAGTERPRLLLPFLPPQRSASPVEQPAVPGFARFLTAARDGTLSSRSTGLPPPLA